MNCFFGFPGSLHVFWLGFIPGGLYRVTATTIRLWQPGGTVELPRARIAAVKPRNVSHVIVRLDTGQRFVLNLFHLGTSGFDVVMGALHESLALNRTRRAARRGRSD